MSASSSQESKDSGNTGPDRSPRREAPGEVLLLDRQRRRRGDWREVAGFLRRLSAELAPAGFTVCLVSDPGIRRYNRRFRGLDQATDVLSFPAGERGNGAGSYLGDILISVETAGRNAGRFGLPLEEEIKLLALHGVLHLLGYDHERDRGEMARLERRWSRRLGLADSLTGRLRQRPAGGAGSRRATR